MSLNSREFKFLKNYRTLYGKSSAKREYRDENVFLKVDRADFFYLKSNFTEKIAYLKIFGC